jgi:sugar lactone lactonase YvrE
MMVSMLVNFVSRLKPELIVGRSFSTHRVALCLCTALFLSLLDTSFRWAQQTGSSLYFANDRVRLTKLIERKEILNYRVVLAGERRFRESFFDSAELFLYHHQMFYRVKESFDGHGHIEFYDGRSGNERPSPGVMHSVALPPSRVLPAREGRLDDAVLRKRLALPAGREFKIVPLAVEYARHTVALERAGRQDFLVSLLVGSFQGFSGRNLRKEFWAVEIEAVPGRNVAARKQEIQRIANYLAPELKLSPRGKSLYAQGVEKAVLLRADERQIKPVNIIGGARGAFPEQFDEPDSVAFTLDGKLLAADTENARFKIYTLADRSQTLRIVGREGSGAGEFDHSLANTLGSFKIYNQVQGIAVDKNGLIFVIDQGNQRIQVFDGDGTVLPASAIPWSYCGPDSPRCPDGLWHPTKKNGYTSLQGLAIDHEGGIFVCDAGTGRIYRFLPDGKLDPRFNLQELDFATKKPILEEPESLAVYRDKLLVADEGGGDIKIFDRRSGKLIGSPEGFGRDVFDGDVEGLAVAGDYLFAVDVQNTRIAVFDLKSETPKYLMSFVGDYETADGIAIDPTGKYVAIADQGNLRIVLYSLPEILNHLAAVGPKG